MALIAMAVYDTKENNRTNFTIDTLLSLKRRVDLLKHRIIIVDNGSCFMTKKVLSDFEFENHNVKVITSATNLGTAEAINLAWHERQPGENCIKMDNDVVVHKDNWVDELEEAIAREPLIGQCGLKRKDCWESPDRTDFYKSELIMLPHKAGEKWIVVEKVNHVMGTAQMYSSALLDKIGYLKQPKVYGFDDSLASYRSTKAGFINVFLPHIEIDHIDPGGTLYQKEKEQIAHESWTEYHRLLDGYKDGTISIYYNPFQ